MKIVFSLCILLKIVWFVLSNDNLNFTTCQWNNVTYHVLKSEYLNKFDYLRCGRSTSWLTANQSKNYEIFQQLTKDNKPSLNVEFKDNRECASVAQPSSVELIFETKPTCNVYNYSSTDVCLCHWIIEELKIVILGYKAINRLSSVEEPVEKLTHREGEFVKLNYTIVADYALSNVTWNHITDKINTNLETQWEIRKFEIISNNFDSRNSSLCLGNVRLNDSGVYEVRVKSLRDKRDYVVQKFSLKVISSNIENVQILAVAPNQTNSKYIKVDTRFLQLHTSYSAMCKTVAYPYPTLDIRRHLCSTDNTCNSTNVCEESNCTHMNGTMEYAKFWNFTARNSSIVNCSAITKNGSLRSLSEQFVVTDIPNAEENNGIYIELVEPNDPVIIQNDTIEIHLWLQKQYTAVVCKFFTSRGKERSTILKAIANESSDNPMKFASHWWLMSLNDSLFTSINVNATSQYSTKFILIAHGVSNLTHNGNINCTASVQKYIQSSSTISLDIKEPLESQWLTEPKNSVNNDGYQPNENFIVNCSGYGIPQPKVDWFDDKGHTLNYTTTFFVNYMNKTTSTLEIKNFTNTVHGGQYCCYLTNKINRDKSKYQCITIKEGKKRYNPSEFQLDTLSKLIFVIMTACTVVLLTVTPMSFQKRTARKMELEDLSRDFEYHLKYEADRLKQNQEHTCIGDPSLQAVETKDQTIYDRKTEIPRDCIKLISEIGSGIQSKVYKGQLTLPKGQGSVMVAIKRTKEERNVDQLKALLHEMGIFLTVGKHPNVLGFIGACTSNLSDGDLYVMVEYCEFGSLEDFLFNCKVKRTFVDELLNDNDATSDFNLNYFDSDSSNADSFNDDAPRVSTKDLISYAYQVAKGMEYLCNKGVIHRDLALRNLLQTKDRVVKIADFGLSRMNNYYQEKLKGVRLPYKWMSLESIMTRKYSPKSDVWSYGIVLWEIFSLADEPYSNMPVDRTFFKWLLSGNRMQCPLYAPEQMHNLMNECWQQKPDDRPTFLEIQQKIKGIYEELFHDSLTLLEADAANDSIEPFAIVEGCDKIVSLPKPIYGTGYHTAVSQVSSDSAYGGSSSPTGSMTKSVDNLGYMMGYIT